MSGFTNSSLNAILRQDYYEQIILILKRCSDLMISKGVKIENHEEKISAHLVENYLTSKTVIDSIIRPTFPFSFFLEVPEKYNPCDDSFAGRLDIKVSSLACLLRENPKDYYTIECKRIDGTKSLNIKYIKEGVARFVVPPIKYPSYHNKNIMFGYVVKTINIAENIKKINDIHKVELSSYVLQNITNTPTISSEYCKICESKYNLEHKSLILSHIFYDISSVIKSLKK